MFFCPRCANLLLVEAANEGQFRLYCRTCPYICPIKNEIKQKVKLRRKEVDDVLGGDAAFQGSQTATVNCQKCGGTRAYFFEIQIRSADEPSTKFYQCTECKTKWRED